MAIGMAYERSKAVPEEARRIANPNVPRNSLQHMCMHTLLARVEGWSLQ